VIGVSWNDWWELLSGKETLLCLGDSPKFVSATDNEPIGVLSWSWMEILKIEVEID